jgi:hypothetical protein
MSDPEFSSAKPKKKFLTITLLTLMGAGFSFSFLSVVSAAEKKEKSKAKTKTKTETTETEEEPDLFLQESKQNVEFLPDIYKCPECGYEQDEPGSCPDHNDMELVKVLSKGRDPLEPSELDGNEDIIVDIPLKNLEFRKDNILKTLTRKKQEGGHKLIVL